MELITQRLKLKDVHPEVAAKVAGEYELDAEEVELVRKGIVTEVKETDEEEMSFVDFITTDSLDRDNEVVKPKGAILDDYRKEPVVMFGHNYRELPIGQNLWIKPKGKGLIAKTQYTPLEANPFGHQVYQYRKAGFPLGTSIGFIPIKTHAPTDADKEKYGDNLKLVYDKWLLLEYSAVPIPSNPDALEYAKTKGLLTDEVKKMIGFEETEELDDSSSAILDRINRGEGTREDWEIFIAPGHKWSEVAKPYPNEHACRIRDPKDFEEGSFRRTEREHEGKKYSVIFGRLKGETKLTEQAYRYKKDIWTASSAKAHCKSHNGIAFEPAKEQSPDEIRAMIISALENVDVEKLVDKVDFAKIIQEQIDKAKGKL